MRITKLFILAAAVSCFIGGQVIAQCAPPNILAKQITQIGQPLGGIPIGQPLVIEYTGPRHLNGKWAYTLASVYSGNIPLGNGYCVPVGYPFFLMGINMFAAQKATMTYQVPNDTNLVGITLYIGGMVADGTPTGNGASNQIQCTIWEDWPLP